MPNNDAATDTQKSLLFGYAERYILNQKDVRILITANLYILGGDVYDSGV